MWAIGNIFNLTSIDTSGNITPSQWYNNNYTSNILQTNTQIAGMIPKQDRNERVTEYSRDLDGVPVGKHSFLLLEPDNMDDFTEEKMKQMGFDTDKFKFIDIGENRKGIIVGAYQEGGFLIGGDLKVEINKDIEIKVIKGYKNNETKTYLTPEARIIKTTKDDTTFIYNILNNTSNYISITEVFPIMYWGIFNNCNEFTNNILNYSGADMNRNKNMKGFDPGKDIKMDDLFFNLKGNKISN